MGSAVWVNLHLIELTADNTMVRLTEAMGSVVWVNLHLIQLTADNTMVRLTRSYGVGCMGKFTLDSANGR